MSSSLAYIANARMPTEKAHGLQIANMCHAFARKKMDVTLVAPKRNNPIKETVFDFYGINKDFKISTVWSWDLIGTLRTTGFWIQQLTFSISAWLVCRKLPKDSLFFSRDIFSAWLLSFGRRKVVFEMHRYPERMKGIWKAMLHRMSGIISTNRWKADMLEREMGYPKDRILVLPNGFDPAIFEASLSRAELRTELSLPAGRLIALYTGHLYDWKGAHVFAEAATQMPDVLCVFVGGTTADLEKFHTEFGHVENILLVGHKTHRVIPKYLLTADVLVLPNSAKSHESQFSTSPIKLFEYLAAGKPIVASDLPSIRELVGDANAVFVTPDNQKALAEGIVDILHRREDAVIMASNNINLSLQYTWEKRADAIIEWTKRI